MLSTRKRHFLEQLANRKDHVQALLHRLSRELQPVDIEGSVTARRASTAIDKLLDEVIEVVEEVTPDDQWKDI